MNTKQYIRQQLSVYKNYLLSSLYSEEGYIKRLYRLGYHREIDLSKPKLFSEKLQWIKLNDHKEIYHVMADKFECKSFITNIIGGGYTIPTIGVWDSFEAIDFDTLPNEFILKPTFDSGTYFICNDKRFIDAKQLRRKLYKYWRTGFYFQSKEWQYKGLKRRLMAEPLIADPKSLFEYKFFCFNGEPKIYQTCIDRDKSKGGAELTFYDLNGEKLPIKDKNHSRNSTIDVPLPHNLELMLRICRELSKDTYFLRVDFYEVNEKLFCGELTFLESAGFCEFAPDEWNRILGDWIKLPMD